MSHPLDAYRLAEHRLAGLCTAVREVLSSSRNTPSDERITPFPDERTLRYYRGLGLLDGPLRQEGREGVYGYRHLLQAAAVKVQQANGLSLAQVRRALVGMPTEALESVVRAAVGPALVSGPVRTLLTRELAPGVIVTVDPACVPDPDRLFARLLTASRSESGSQT